MKDWIIVKSNFFISTSKNKNYDLRYNKGTGDFEIRERDSSGNYISENIYLNGSWTKSALDIPELIEYSPTDQEKNNPIQTQKAKEINTSARRLTKDAYTNARFTSPLNEAAKLTDQEAKITNISNTSENTGVSTSPSVGNLFSPIGPIAEFPSVPNPAVGKVLKYPLDLISDYQDILSIKQIEYQSPYKDLFTADGQTAESIVQSGLIRGSIVKEELKGEVILPMPNQAQDSNNVSWGKDDMDALTSSAAATVSRNILGAAGGIAAAEIANGLNLPPMLSSIVANSPKIILLSKLLTAAATGGAESESVLKSAGLSFLLNKFGFDVPAETILSRGFGVIPNSNVQLLFNNVQLRGFTFNYILSPRSKSEAVRVNQILRWFKQGMAAKKRTLQGGGALLLGTPNVFKLEYKSGKKSIKGVNKFKICALTSFNVNYTPGQNWVAFEEGQPSAVGITMGFQEIEPIYDTDYQNKTNNNDAPSVADDEIGF